MRYVCQKQIFGFFLLVSVISSARAKLKDFVNDKMHQVYNRTNIPIEIYVGYSHDPWGEIQHVKQEQKQHEENGEESATRITDSNGNGNNNRSRRSALQLYNMVVCATGCNPLLYKGYGCYCGFLGSGYPVDPIDRCCKMHDWCYDQANCPVFLEYFIPYVWTCYMRRPICSMGESCSQRLCECDRRLAECLRRYHCPLNKAVCSSSPWRNHKWTNY